ncbi:MAG: HesA/MoeB/ThiF family protein, partial [Spirochaetia bacterium]|nr:HesA/MoeB/ThiF family protein [Spirochaetia bacterium]
DHQFPEESNLNRQFVHCLVGPSVSKADSAAAWVASLNPDAEVVAVTGSLERTDAVEMLRGCDVILDCLDNNESRLRLNSFALKGRIPVIHAAVQEWHGQVMVVDAGVGPCLGCILPSHGCSSPPVIGSVAGVIGSLQASEAIKVITGIGEALIGRLLSVDISRNSYQCWDLERKPGCPHCSSLIE